MALSLVAGGLDFFDFAPQSAIDALFLLAFCLFIPGWVWVVWTLKASRPPLKAVVLFVAGSVLLALMIDVLEISYQTFWAIGVGCSILLLILILILRFSGLIQKRW